MPAPLELNESVSANEFFVKPEMGVTYLKRTLEKKWILF